MQAVDRSTDISVGQIQVPVGIDWGGRVLMPKDLSIADFLKHVQGEDHGWTVTFCLGNSVAALREEHDREHAEGRNEHD